LKTLDRDLPDAIWVRAIVPAIGFAGLCVFGTLYAFRPDWYFRFMSFFISSPFDYPFVDAQGIIAAVDCGSRGIDVFLQQPCDVLNRAFSYSPLWTRLTFLPTDKTWTNEFGVVQAALFLLSLAFLPQPRRKQDLELVILATFSSATVFAVERGNPDLLMFVLAVITGRLVELALPRRILGYMSILLAGLLKYYPFVLLLLLVRERFARFVAFALIAVAVMACFVWQYHDELVTAMHDLPIPYYFADNFGARQLPVGLPAVLDAVLSVFGWSGDRTRHALRNPDLVTGLHVLLVIAAVLLAAWLAFNAGFRAAILALPPREMNFLVVGAALVCGCFFAGQNIAYRGIHLLLALPALLLLARSPAGACTRALFRWTGYALIGTWPCNFSYRARACRQVRAGRHPSICGQ
jgi:hypothetical protein